MKLIYSYYDYGLWFSSSNLCHVHETRVFEGYQCPEYSQKLEEIKGEREGKIANWLLIVKIKRRKMNKYW